MSKRLQVEEELAHIRTAVLLLERLSDCPKTADRIAVMQTAYWRTRVSEVLALPDTPRHVANQGSAILARLDNLSLRDTYPTTTTTVSPAIASSRLNRSRHASKAIATGWLPSQD
jgi:hypothetical protein